MSGICFLPFDFYFIPLEGSVDYRNIMKGEQLGFFGFFLLLEVSPL